MQDIATKAKLEVKLSDVELSYTNTAPDFIDVYDDVIQLKLELLNECGETVVQPEQELSATFQKNSDEDHSKIRLKNSIKPLEFELTLDEIMEIWMGNYEIAVSNKYESYISYKPISAELELHWFQWRDVDSEYHFLSETKKNYNPKHDNNKEVYSIRDIEICAEMIGKAIQKIDLRTRGAVTKFNTDNGRLEPIIISIGDKLGYEIKALELVEIRQFALREMKVSHSITLKG